jgi:hypothetical protein
MRAFDRRLRHLKRRAPKRPRRTRRRAKPVTTRGMLEADSVAVDGALLASPKARRCGGARRAPGSRIATKVLWSDTHGLTVRVTLPQAHFGFRRLGGRDWSEFDMDGTSTGGGTGKPGLPSFDEEFAIPTGANVSVRASKVSSYTLHGVNLLPHQPDPVDADQPAPGRPPERAFLDKPFKINRRAYRSRSPFPAKPAGLGGSGVMRDIRIGGVTLAGGQYRPRRKTLKVITSIDVRVTFGGDNKGTFGDARIGNPFNATFNRLYRSAVINSDVVFRNPGGTVYPFCGEEVLIVTSPALRPAANTLRTQKETEGFFTRVVETGTGPGQIGTTAPQIQSFIRGELNSGCWLRPSYVILVGNTDNVPTFEVPCSPGGDATECNIAADNPYAMKDDADYLPDTALGRISAPDLATANTVVGKLVGYESTPPAPPGDDFYHHFTVTSYFEPTYICELNEGASGTPNCDPNAGAVTGHYVFHPEITQDGRGFTKTSEAVRNAMLARGYTADRLYTADPATDPQTFYDGTPMPAAIRKPGFPWNAGTTEFVNAINQGRNIVFHRDHGWPDGWSAPQLWSGDVPSLTNGTKLPVTFGINCSSAAFDDPANPSFTEELLQKPDGGSVGGFGDTRVSNTWANNSISFGFFDALFPNLVPSYGSPDPLQRMGDVLVAGKNYMASHDAGALYGHSMLYGYFGDPTMQLWIDPPRTFDPSKLKAEVRRDSPPIIRPPGPGPDPPPFYVLVNIGEQGVEGTLVTLEERGGEVVGRGVVRGGQAVIFPDRSPRNTAGMQIRLQNQGFFGQQAPVQGQ